MAEVFPSNPLPAESLAFIHQGGHDGLGKTLTLRMRSRSLVRYTRTTLIATRCPSCVPCDTSTKPPDSASTEPSEQSGMCMDDGITRCRLHVLQSLLSNFSRSRSGMASFSRRCRLYQPWERGGEDMERLTPFISLTRLWISGSESCRNWKKEAIRGSLLQSSRRAVWCSGCFSYYKFSVVSNV